MNSFLSMLRPFPCSRRYYYNVLVLLSRDPGAAEGARDPGAAGARTGGSGPWGAPGSAVSALKVQP